MVLPITAMLKKMPKVFSDVDNSSRFNQNLQPAFLKYFSWLLFVFAVYFLIGSVNLAVKEMREALFGYLFILLFIMGKK